MTYLIIGLLIVAGLALLITWKMKSSIHKSEATEQPDEETLTTVDPQNNPYHDLRNLALSATAQQIGVKIPDDQTRVYGVVMDWHLGEGTATLVAFISGDASLYLSSGGGVVGGRGHEHVKTAGAAFIDKAESFLAKMVKTSSTPLPDKDGVRFYFLTNKGKFVGHEHMQNFETGTSPWLDLFNDGNKLITEIRLVGE